MWIIQDQYYLSPEQAQAILELKLHRLTGLETEKIHVEYKELIIQIRALLEILENPDRLHIVIRDELQTVKQDFGDVRRTVIMENQEDLCILLMILIFILASVKEANGMLNTGGN